ncbi:kinase-like domain-containing protein [Hysterangium stoloniferum]|nr:kinase-like domain-containing protein [Hysterangium stoloniferum]
MTDIPSGLKRPYEGDRDGSWKRRREEEESRPRDWRDVHLKTDSYRVRDRGGNSYRRGNDYYYRDSRDRERDRDRDRDRGDRRHKDKDKERERDRDRDRDRDRERDHKRPHSRNSRPRDDEKKRSNKIQDNGHSKGRVSDMEEGEISPPRRDPSRARSSSYSVSSRRSEPPKPLPQGDHKPREAHKQTEPAPLPKPPTPQPEPELELVVPEEELSIEQQIAARRAKRAAILAKYAPVSAASSSSQTPDGGTPSATIQPLVRDLTLEDQSRDLSAVPRDVDVSMNDGNVRAVSRSASPSSQSITDNAFSLAKESALEAEATETRATEDGEQISAADYDPSLDRREDEARRVRGLGGEPMGVIEVLEGEVVDEEDDEDIDDMFAIATLEPKKKKNKIRPALKPVITTTTLDSAADPEGYYQIILGEQLDGGRYQVFSSLGKGMFSNVVRARILTGEGAEVGKEVAIKIVRAQESMYRAGQKEVQIINKIRQADPEDKKHIVKLERTFEHRGHLCLVFESLSMNLRDVIKRFGKDVGLNIRAVRAYTTQLFLALGLLRKCSIMHADIKPDNILVSENKTMLKVCDFGSASDVSENDITPYLVSRFYRAPEIILGLPYDASLDIWSIGCTLYELYTGKILFPGRSNNQMLLLMMELKGRFNSKMVKKAKFGDMYFDEMGGFLSVERDKVTGNDVTKTVHISKPSRDLRARLIPPKAKDKDEETKMVLSFIDLLDKCLVLDPARRLTPKDALMHPFVRGL